MNPTAGLMRVKQGREIASTCRKAPFRRRSIPSAERRFLEGTPLVWPRGYHPRLWQRDYSGRAPWGRDRGREARSGAEPTQQSKGLRRIDRLLAAAHMSEQERGPQQCGTARGRSTR